MIVINCQNSKKKTFKIAVKKKYYKRIKWQLSSKIRNDSCQKLKKKYYFKLQFFFYIFLFWTFKNIYTKNKSVYGFLLFASKKNFFKITLKRQKTKKDNNKNKKTGGRLTLTFFHIFLDNSDTVRARLLRLIRLFVENCLGFQTSFFSHRSVKGGRSSGVPKLLLSSCKSGLISSYQKVHFCKL